MEEIKAAAWNPNDKERQATTYASIVISFLSEVIHKLSTGSNYEQIELQLRSSIYHYAKLCDIVLPGDPPNLNIQPGAVCEPDFIEFIKNEREAIIKAMLADEWWLTIPAGKRVVIENMLIAYDQMVSRLTEGRKPSLLWIKASEFKTTKPLFRPYRKKREDKDPEYDYGEIYITEDKGKIFLDVNGELLYEPQTFERWKDYEILDESGAAPSGEREVAFAEWMRENKFRPFTNGRWIKLETGEIRTSEQLHELFKQNRNNENS